MRTRVGAVLTLVGLLGCSQPPTDEGKAVESAKPTPAATVDFPAGVGVKVVSDKGERTGSKRRVEVEVDRRVTTAELTQIANAIHSKADRPYERTFILHYLPGMPRGGGAWATTHFEPSLKVEILGLSAEGFERVLAAAASETRPVKGKWLVEQPHASRLFLLVEVAGKSTMVHRMFFANEPGKADEYPVKVSDGANGRRFDPVPPIRDEERWVVSPSGELSVYSGDDLFAVGAALK